MAAVNVLWERRSDAPVRFSLVPRELLEVYVRLFSYIPVPQDSLTKVSASACLSSSARPSSSPSSSHSSPSSSSSFVPQLLFRGSAWSPPPASHHPAALHLHYWVLFLQVPFVLRSFFVLFRGRPSLYFIAKVHVVKFERNCHLNTLHPRRSPATSCNQIMGNLLFFYLESPSKDLG